MARGADGKARRKEARKNKGNEAEQEFGDSELPMPPSSSGPPIEEDDSDIAAVSDDDVPAPTKKKKKKKAQASATPQMQAQAPPKEGIKTLPLIFLVIMTGSTVLPALIFAGDWFGNNLQKHNLIGQLGFRLGVGATPKKRVLSFYEKHDPTKINAVPGILSKHYGSYPTMIKKIERKYGDYGYFQGWEEDEAPMALAMEKLQETRAAVVKQWNRHAPLPIKTALRNIQYNVGGLYKKFKKIWKKTLWPLLEPIIGVPKGASAQKRKDKADARKKTGSSSGGGRRRKNTEFRDDVEEEDL